MQLDENWAIDANRIREFFRYQNDVTEAEGLFFYKNCRITLTPLPPQTGIFAVPRTEVRITGPEEEVRKIHHRFFLRFLSAGG